MAIPPVYIDPTPPSLVPVSAKYDINKGKTALHSSVCSARRHRVPLAQAKAEASPLLAHGAARSYRRRIRLIVRRRGGCSGSSLSGCSLPCSYCYASAVCEVRARLPVTSRHAANRPSPEGVGAGVALSVAAIVGAFFALRRTCLCFVISFIHVKHAGRKEHTMAAQGTPLQRCIERRLGVKIGSWAWRVRVEFARHAAGRRELGRVHRRERASTWKAPWPRKARRALEPWRRCVEERA